MKTIGILIAAMALAVGGFGINAAPARAGMGFWTSISPANLDCRVVQVDPTDGSNYSMGLYGNGVMRTPDYGTSWQDFNDGLIGPNWFAGMYVHGLSIDYNNPARMFISTFGTGVFRTDSGGNWWYQINSGLNTLYVYSLAMDPTRPGTLFAGTGHGVYRNQAGGDEPWQQVLSTTASVLAMAIDPTNTGYVYAGTDGNGLWQSKDGGTSWTRINHHTFLNNNVSAIAVAPNDPSVIYAGTKTGSVWVSHNGGGTWLPIWQGMGTGKYITALAVDPDDSNIAYAATENNGIYKTSDGITWQEINNGLQNGTRVYDLVIHPTSPSKLLAATSQGAYSMIQIGEPVPIN
jgi:photosystem II stability/assembly factor-like uncharacterized protein